MKVYLLYETKDADEYGIGSRDDIVGVFASRKKAEKAEREYASEAKKNEQDYDYNVVSEEVL